MQQRLLGRTGLQVSIMGLGASPLGGVFGPVDLDQAIRTVHTALDLGITYIDTSPYYGLTRSETVLGQALKGVPRDRYILSTKVGRYHHHEFDFSPARVIRSVDESLTRLGIDHIDILLCHDIEFVSLDQIVQETIPALRRLRQTGKVRFIGISGLPLKIFRYVLDHTDLDVVLSYCHWTLHDQSLATLLPYLKEKDLGIINAAALAMGLLSTRPAPPWHPAPPPLKHAAQQAAELCRRAGTPIETLAIQFATSHPDIATTLVGMASPEEVRQNVAALDQPLDQHLLQQVQTIFAPVPNLTWPTGRPENS